MPLVASGRHFYGVQSIVLTQIGCLKPIADVLMKYCGALIILLSVILALNSVVVEDMIQLFP